MADLTIKNGEPSTKMTIDKIKYNGTIKYDKGTIDYNGTVSIPLPPDVYIVEVEVTFTRQKCPNKKQNVKINMEDKDKEETIVMNPPDKLILVPSMRKG